MQYGGPITLGTALTISGAAASPNMGYHSSPAVTLLMTLLNVRLGWWLGNPAAVQDQWYHRFLNGLGISLNTRLDPRRTVHRRPDPSHSVLPLLNEAFGQTNDEYSYVYLSDGGHFDNLGLYEMVRRRCKVIIVSDASCDPEFKLDDLGNALRKIQNDMGVTIDLREVLLFPRERKRQKNKYCAVGEIRYRDVDGPNASDGILIYLKPALHKREPADVYNHSRSNRHFPHEPTANQWFSEAQFESYRKLGYELICCLGERMQTLKKTAVHSEPGRSSRDRLQKAARRIDDPLGPFAAAAVHDALHPGASKTNHDGAPEK